VYTGGNEGVLLALDGATGNGLWFTDLGAIRPMQPAIADGSVYVGTFGSLVQAYRVPAGDGMGS
jgi:outer membrane protein assembly factor BamB